MTFFYPVFAFNKFVEKNILNLPENLKKALPEPAGSVVMMISTIIIFPFMFLPVLYGIFVLWLLFLATEFVMGFIYRAEPPFSHVVIALLIVYAAIFIPFIKRSINNDGDKKSE